MVGQAGAPRLPQQQRNLATAVAVAVSNLLLGPAAAFLAALLFSEVAGLPLDGGRGEGRQLTTP
eukprot:10396650-Prorocentrum_lima.AAC.1